MTETIAGQTTKLNGKKWVFPAKPKEEDLKELSSIKGLHPVVAELLFSRGIQTEELLKHFFNPSLDDLHDPFLMKDMDKAVARVKEAFDREERIMVFGDYDVDGTTSTALVFKFLSQWYDNLEYYIPDRYAEGYGISYKGIDVAKENGVRLIIALDCGIKAVDKVLYAKEKGIDFIICDHHIPGDEIPEASAVLDPKRSDCAYPYKELSGCGVGFKLMQAICDSFFWEKESLYAMLDLVAVSIGSDIVPITGENRIMMHFGLEQINTKASPGLQALINVAGFKPGPSGGYSLKVDRLVFGLGPRINAAGRIGHGSGAVRLLVSKSEEDATDFASKVDDLNVERKELDKNITQEALTLISASVESLDAFSTVLFQPHWHKGVIGIVASRCIEKHHRPTIILTESDGKLTGSGRSVFGFDLYTALEACSEYLIQFGGHYHAAGLTLKKDQFEGFQKAFENQVQLKMSKEDLRPRLVIDAELPLNRISQGLLKQVQRIGPFGPYNMNPLFVGLSVHDSGMSRLLENKNGGPAHIKFSVTHRDLVFEGKPYALDGIGFGLGEFWPLVCSGEPFDMAFHLDENVFREKKSLQLMVKEIRPSKVGL